MLCNTLNSDMYQKFETKYINLMYYCSIVIVLLDLRSGVNLIVVENFVHAFRKLSLSVGQTKQQVYVCVVFQKCLPSKFEFLAIFTQWREFFFK